MLAFRLDMHDVLLYLLGVFPDFSMPVQLFMHAHSRGPFSGLKRYTALHIVLGVDSLQRQAETPC